MKGGAAMTSKEVTNIIIRLAEMGFSNKEINAFIGFIETHNHSEEEVNAAINKAAEKDNG